MIIAEKDIIELKLNRLIGKPINVDLRKLKTIGSSSFHLKKFINKTDKSESLKIDSKCNFEIFEKGLLFRSNYSNKLNAIPIPKNELIKINLIKGKELINPFPLSPMWILLKLGVSILYARYFQIWWFNEYKIDEMTLMIKTKDYEMSMITNSYIFERQQKFFESLNLNDKIMIDKTPVANNS